MALLPGQNYIFAVGDGSDEGLTFQTISITLNNTVFNFADAKTTLAPDGVLNGNVPQLGGGDETQPWTLDANLLGATVPEPLSFTLCGLGLALAALFNRVFRRRGLTAV